MITIVRPVVRSTSEVTIAEVLEDRFINELKDVTNAKIRAEELAKKYRGAELPRCRLKATLSYMGTIVSSGMSNEDIVDKVSFLNLPKKDKKHQKLKTFLYFRMLEILPLTFSVSLITFAPEVVGEAL